MKSVLLALTLSLFSITAHAAEPLAIEKNDHIVLLGNGLGSRMMQYGFFEAGLHLRHSDKSLFVRNMCDEGNTPSFRPHSARPSPWAFPGAEKFNPPLSKNKNRWGSGQTGTGSMDSSDQWLTRLQADTIIAFFGFNESFRGPSGIDNFKGELNAFIEHTRSQKYNGS